MFSKEGQGSRQNKNIQAKCGERYQYKVQVFSIDKLAKACNYHSGKGQHLS